MDLERLTILRIKQALRARSEGTSDFDLNPGVRGPAPAPLREAAVLVPLVERSFGLAIVLTRRAALLKHHPGQVAFPGGKRDPEDTSLVATALREANEEIGLDPAHVSVLGELPSHETITSFAVTPIVGLVAPQSRTRIDRLEVDEVFEVPAAYLLDPASFQVHSRRWQGRPRHYYVVPWGPHYIWGATARMLRVFADRLVAS